MKEIGIKVEKDKDEKMKFIFLRPFEKIMEELNDYVEHLQSQNAGLKEKIEELNNFNKDEEIKKYEQMINEISSHSIYLLSDDQKQQMDNFKMEHYKKCKCDYYDIIITPNEIFTAIKIQCKKCKEELDLTFYGGI